MIRSAPDQRRRPQCKLLDEARLIDEEVGEAGEGAASSGLGEAEGVKLPVVGGGKHGGDLRGGVRRGYERPEASNCQF